MAAPKTSIPENIAEEYYQISEAILSSFPKYRPPLDLFYLREDLRQLLTYSRKGSRLSNEQVEEIHKLCEEGNLFVSRADHPIYSQHIVKQLDLVLLDKNLKEAEIADICIRALELRLADFFDQPVKPVFERLYTDIMVISEFLRLDKHRIRLFVRRMHRGDHTLVRHSINTMFIGFWLYTELKADDLRRKDFDQALTALLLHDSGMSKVPVFILAKTTPLKPEEREKIVPHPLLGYRIMDKLEQTHDYMRQACLEHHERLDGSGYPQRSKDAGSFGKLTAVADAFSAMLQKRPYAEAKTPSEAARELAADKTKFDAVISGKLLAAFLAEPFGNMT